MAKLISAKSGDTTELGLMQFAYGKLHQAALALTVILPKKNEFNNLMQKI
jgi:hypothetical protein